jgi:hypothetical protein
VVQIWNLAPTSCCCWECFENEIFIVELHAIYLSLNCISDHASYPNVRYSVSLSIRTSILSFIRYLKPQWRQWRCAEYPSELGFSTLVPILYATSEWTPVPTGHIGQVRPLRNAESIVSNHYFHTVSLRVIAFASSIR